MSGTVHPEAEGYTLAELADLLGISTEETSELLDEHGYELPDEGVRLPLTEEGYRDLMEAALIEDEGGE